jgi:Hemocyanin, copper containing domain/Hemocyanin, all-alpha domain
MMTLYRNGWFVERGKPFSLMRERNIVTTKALFDFFDTMNDWNTVAMNLIWARRNVNEYQFWHLMTLLCTHNRHMNNLVLPAAYEVFPQMFFTADVLDQATKLGFSTNTGNKGNKVVIMSNYTTGVLGSTDNDDNHNTYDLNDIKNGMNKINDWNTLKTVAYEIKNQQRMTMNNQMTHRMNKDINNKIFNNNRMLTQGNKFNNNGEDRMVYFTEDIGLNNYYYFSRIGNSRIVGNNQMYNNDNNKETFLKRIGKTVTSNELNGKINRRGERYVYKLKQLLARYNLERKSNGLDNVQDITIDGTIDNGVYPNLGYTNGLQMPNRQNNLNLNTQNNVRLIQVTQDFENRFYRAIDQGFVLTEDGKKVDLHNKNGMNILGNLLQGNRDSVNIQYYRYLEYYYRLLFGGNNVDNADFNDNRFVPTVLDHYETSMRDSVFWQIIKRITNIVNKFSNKLTGYKTQDVNFNGVKINNVKVDKLVTYFNYFDGELS